MEKNEVEKMMGLGREKVKIEEVKIEEYKRRKVKMIYLKQISNRCRCPKCNQYTKSVHDVLKRSYIRELDFLGYECVFTIKKRRFHCYKCNHTFTENLSLLPKRCFISNKVKIQMHKDLLDILSFKYIAKKNHVSSMTVINELKEIMKNQKEQLLTLPEIISIDEFKADTDKEKYACIINDPIKKKTLDILPNRTKEYLIQYFTSVENRKKIKFVISDMYRPYLEMTKIMFPNAKYVVDRFHFETYIMDALDKIRIRLQKQYGYNSNEYRLLKNKKNVTLLRLYSEKIEWFKETTRYRNKKVYRMLPGDILNELKEIHEDLKNGYDLKELFLQIVHETTLQSAKADLNIWIELCKESKIDEFITAANTIENWLEYIVNSFIDQRFSNGYTEGLNNKIKVIKRISFGYKKFDIFRSRLIYILDGKLK